MIRFSAFYSGTVTYGSPVTINVTGLTNDGTWGYNNSVETAWDAAQRTGKTKVGKGPMKMGRRPSMQELQASRRQTLDKMQGRTNRLKKVSKGGESDADRDESDSESEIFELEETEQHFIEIENTSAATDDDTDDFW